MSGQVGIMRKVIASGLTLVFAASLVRCSDDLVGPPAEITGLPRDLTGAEQELIQSDNAFGLKLFREIHAQEEPGVNLFISPLSVAMALGMTYNGAAGTTYEAMQETLELEGLSLEEANESYRSLIDLLRGLDSSVEFELANSIWYRQGYRVEPEFLDVNREYFDAEVTALDFSAPTAKATINGWVEDKTRGRIEEIVERIDALSVMFLINAIYFKGSWTAQFAEELTAEAPFYLAGGGQKNVEMMSTADAIDVSVYWERDVTVLDLPYGGRAYSMTIVMPAAGTDMASFVGTLDSGRWQAWVDGLSSSAYVVKMPKFTLEYGLKLNDVLKALGMEIAFVPGGADFTKINPTPGLLYISEVRHKSFVDVNEEGTEAAAATVVEIRETSAPSRVVIDRPFLFAIRERFSGTILFMGLIMDPTLTD
jgi:serine protease inhibitor